MLSPLLYLAASDAAFKLLLTPLLLAAISVQGLGGHVLYRLIHTTLAVNFLMAAAWSLAHAHYAVFNSSGGVGTREYVTFFTVSTGVAAGLGVLHGDVVWMLVAWLRWLKVTRPQTWAGRRSPSSDSPPSSRRSRRPRALYS